MTIEHISIDFLSDWQKANLKKLADFLSASYSLNFNMTVFGDRMVPASVETKNRKTYESECGSVGCAVGHGPFAGIKPLKNESWFQYSERVFGATTISEDIRPITLFACLFSGAWGSYDNTPLGAANRIYYVLKHGMPRCSYGEFGFLNDVFTGKYDEDRH